MKVTQRFCNLQRLCDYVDSGLSFNQAMELVRASSLYTVHTPVPAGHDYFDESLFGKYMGGYPSRLGFHGTSLLEWVEKIQTIITNVFCLSTFCL